MATLEEVYCKFGLAAEAAQLFETELGTLLFGAHGAERAWYIQPEPDAGRKLMGEIEGHTLGALLKNLKQIVTFDEATVDRFASALKARNRLIHGFFLRHNFANQTDEGRDKMLAELAELHQELFVAWQCADAMTHLMLQHMIKEKERALAPDRAD
jgi:hypothetical protein